MLSRNVGKKLPLLAASVRNYHYSLRNDPEERSSQLLCGGSLRSRREETDQIFDSFRRTENPIIIIDGTSVRIENRAMRNIVGTS